MSKLFQLAILLIVLKIFAPEAFTLAVDILTKILTIFSGLISSFQNGTAQVDVGSLDLTNFGL